MKNALLRSLLIGLLLSLAACSGVPLRSLPRLANLPTALQQGDPADLMLAVQMDSRLAPPPNATPQLIVKITPADPTDFKPVDRRLPMGMISPPPTQLGLPAAGRGRRWLIYSLTADSQREFAELRDWFKRLRADQGQKKGGTLGVGIAQEGMATRDPSLADTEWDSWLQVSRQEGFFRLWSGTVADLIAQGRR